MDASDLKQHKDRREHCRHSERRILVWMIVQINFELERLLTSMV
jgi:hypothetical protein